VNAAPDAYAMGAPDGTISAWLYASNMVLATFGGTESSGRKPLHDLLLGTTVAANAPGAVYYLYNMTVYQKKIRPEMECFISNVHFLFYCLIKALACTADGMQQHASGSGP
jgi:hypothetical protein